MTCVNEKKRDPSHRQNSLTEFTGIEKQKAALNAAFCDDSTMCFFWGAAPDPAKGPALWNPYVFLFFFTLNAL